MKKVISLIITLIVLTGVFPISVVAYNVGDVVGYALSTDIAATINGYDIPSYNVDGYTYIVVEDLRYYGFAVNYDNASRSLSVTRDLSQTYPSKVYEKPYVAPGKVGAKEHKLLFTDIVTYLDGYYVHSFNINGQTIIRFDSLSAYGGVAYDNGKREISLSLSGIASNPNPTDREKLRQEASKALSKSDFLDRANGWWVDLNSCSRLGDGYGCLLEYIHFSSAQVEFGSTYSEFFTYRLTELDYIGNNTYDALLYSDAYWYGDEYFPSSYSSATIICDGGNSLKITFDEENWFTYTYIGTGHDYDSIQRHPLVIQAVNY